VLLTCNDRKEWQHQRRGGLEARYMSNTAAGEPERASSVRPSANGNGNARVCVRPPASGVARACVCKNFQRPSIRPLTHRPLIPRDRRTPSRYMTTHGDGKEKAVRGTPKQDAGGSTVDIAVTADSAAQWKDPVVIIRLVHKGRTAYLPLRASNSRPSDLNCRSISSVKRAPPQA
jgi:hypothetical protein